MLFGVVLPMFLLHCVALCPRTLSEKVLQFLGPRFEKISGVNSWFFGVLLKSFGAVLPMFFIAWVVPPFLGPLFAETFRKRTAGVWNLRAVVVFSVVLPLFLFHCVILFSRKLFEAFSAF